MHARSLQTLEFPKILERLAAHTSFSAGRELALALQPSSDPAAVAQGLQETREALHLLTVRANVQLGGAHDVRPLVAHARLGATLQPPDLLDMRDTLACARAVRRTLLRLAADPSTGSGQGVPRLAEIASRLSAESHAADEISRCVNDRAEVVDGASPALQKIRRDLKVAHARLMDRLQKMIGSAEFGRFIQEPIITQRSGRYVIPLKADFKGRVPGIVHDQSASGATLFIEPLATVEQNNTLRELQLAEQKEVERILAELSAHVADEGDRIVWSVESLADLDLAFARAKYAEALRATEPLMTVDGGRQTVDRRLPSAVHLINARHPLLNPETVVPISLALGGERYILVITGPNTGGKTVTLKTAGLLSLMAQAGLFIPADAGSALPVFADVFADIGDEQSIEQSLSTFSSHMRNVVEFVQYADDRTLVLLDELGAGTDPVEGSALAQAILEHLRRRGVMALVATHYTELKLYAHATPGVQNASVEFDPETLQPTYHLTVGLPGRSNALAIATRLGLDAQIADAARERLPGEHLQADKLLADLKNARQAAEADQQATAHARAVAERLEQELRGRLARIEDEKREVLNQARRAAEQEVEAVQAELAEIRRRLQAAGQPADLAAEESRLEQLAETLEPVRSLSEHVQGRGATGPLAVGDRVWIPSLNQRGEVTALSGGEAEVQVGNLRLRLREGQVEKEASAAETPRRGVSTLRVQTSTPAPAAEIHLRGLRAEDALLALEKYLDDAYLSGLPRVRVVHGKGTGALRRAVREALEHHPLVAGFRSGDRYEGEDGVTVVELMAR